MKKPHWLDEEVSILVREPKANLPQLMKLLPNRTRRSIRVKRRRLGLSVLAPKPFNCGASYSLAYVLGVLYRDGCVCREGKNWSIVLRQTREEFATSFADALEDLGLRASRFVAKPRPPQVKPQIVVKASSILFSQWFNALTFKDVEVILRSVQFKAAFVRGFYESEGNLSFYKPGHRRISLYNNNRELLHLITMLLQDMGLRPRLYSRLVGPSSFAYRPGLNKQRWELRVVGNPQVVQFLNLMQPVIKA